MLLVNFFSRRRTLVVACIICISGYAAFSQPAQAAEAAGKAPVKVILLNLAQTYDGAPKRAGAVTAPAGLDVSFTYDGSSTAPTKAGRYIVVGTVNDANYEGSATGVLTISKAGQKIDFPALAARMYGGADFAPGAAASSGLGVLYTSSNPKVATVVENRAHIVGAGTTTITAAQAGSGNYLAAEPVGQELTVNKARAKITLSNLQQTYDGTPKSAGAKTEPEGLAVTLTYDGKAAVPVNAGSYTVTATVEDANYEGSTEGGMTIAKAPQSITFNALAERTYGDMTFDLSSTVSSGLTVTYGSSNPVVAAISGSTMKIMGAGTAEITAYQAGDENHLSANPVTRTLTVNKAPQTITFAALVLRTYGDMPFALAATVSSGLTASYTSSDSAVAAVSGSEVRIGNAGTAEITAYQAGDSNYLAAEPVKQVLTVNKAPQSIKFNALPVRTYGDEMPFLLFSTTSSGLTATYESSSKAVATIKGNEVKTAASGTTTITANQAGDSNYLPAKPVQQVLTVKKAPAWIAPLDQRHTYDGTPKPVKIAIRPQGLSVNITYDGNTAPPVEVGRYRVKVTVQDANYEGSATGTIIIGRERQKIEFPVLEVKTFGEGPFTLSAVTSSGLPAMYESSDPTVAVISGSQVTIKGAGTAMITAFHEGDRNYEPAEPVKRPLIVRGQKPHLIVFPVENLSGRPAPLKEIRKALIESLTSRGGVVLDDETMQKFMARHRVRYTGGVDTFTARAWKEETGMEAVLITSLDQYDESEIPKITLTGRLVSVGELAYILWMEDMGLSGNDSPGLFGSGLIQQIGLLQNKAVKQLIDSLTAFYTDRKVPAAKGQAMGAFKPKKAAEIPFLEPGKGYTVAVMPFYNRSRNSKAGEMLALRFVSQLVKNKAFQVLEPGVVRQKLLNFRTVMHEGPSKEDVRSFFLNVGTDLIIMGRVLDYQEGNLSMEFEVQVYDGKSQSMVWSSWSYNQGHDAVVLFDWNQVNNAGELASNMAKSVVRDMTEE
jgi:MBG domain-containing protein